MESAPPPYSAGPKKSRTGLIVGLVILGLFVCCGLPILFIGGVGVWAINKGGPTIGCTVSMTTMQRSLRQYTRDNGGKLPPADKWEEALRPIYATQISKPAREMGTLGISMMPVDGPWGCTEGTRKTGLAFNKDLAGKKVDDIKNPEATPVLFEVEKPGKNLVQPYKALPKEKSPGTMGMAEPRGWFEIPAEGDVMLSGKAVANQSFNTGP